MGDPKYSRKKYENPPHPWQQERIQNENEYINYYGLKNKKEFWKARSALKNIRGKARNLQARLRYGDKQALQEKEEFIDRLRREGFLKGEESTLNDILNLTVENILNRRLQSIVYHKGLAHSPKQARQFVVHGHIQVDGRKVTVPSYVVPRNKEPTVEYRGKSPLSDELHPERPEEETSPVKIDEQMKKDKEKQKYSRRRR